MTKRECAIVMVYTGVCTLQGNDLKIFHKYCEELIGYPLQTIEYSDPIIEAKLKNLAKNDFVKLCSEATD